jgi:hypothetical protein
MIPTPLFNRIFRMMLETSSCSRTVMKTSLPSGNLHRTWNGTLSGSPSSGLSFAPLSSILGLVSSERLTPWYGVVGSITTHPGISYLWPWTSKISSKIMPVRHVSSFAVKKVCAVSISPSRKKATIRCSSLHMWGFPSVRVAQKFSRSRSSNDGVQFVMEG